MRILLFGKTGQLAREILDRSAQRDFTVVSLDRDGADLTDPGSVARAVAAHNDVDVVINAAAYTAVDQAESDEATAFAVNAEAPAAMAKACAAAGLKLIHISTDYVFDGGAAEAYPEDAPVAPLSAYGRSKAAGEAAVREALDEHIIVRTAWVYSPHGKNFVKTMLRLAAERPELRVVDDQRGCPTAAADLADAVLDIAAAVHKSDDPRWGTYHFVNAGETTWRGFAEAIFELSEPWSKVRPRVLPLSTAEYPTPARRPANSALRTDALTRAFGVRPRPWRTALADVLQRIYDDQGVQR